VLTTMNYEFKNMVPRRGIVQNPQTVAQTIVAQETLSLMVKCKKCEEKDE
jgi:hypothetical protein